MPKVKKIKSVVKCECSKCGQVAFVEPNQTHAFCRGFKLSKPLPTMFASLHGKNKGTWIPYQAPVAQPMQDAILVPVVSEASGPID